MPRRPRIIVAGKPHHLIQRGNNRQDIFTQEADYIFYLETLKQGCLKYQCQLHAYVLMTNHIHLLITPMQESSISALMQYIGRIYVRYFNVLYKRTGTLFEARFKSSVIDSEVYLLICHAYIELNPVRANRVKFAQDHPYSSYTNNALGQDDDLLTPHMLYLELGCNKSERLKQYKSIIDDALAIKTINVIRNVTNKGLVLGDQGFLQKIEKQIKRKIQFFTRGGDRKSERFRNQLL